MKNETARREIESLDYYLQNHTDDYSEESHTAMMMAIKALEQEPCDVFDEYGNYKYPSDVELTEPNTATSMPCEDAISRSDMLDAIGHGTTYTSEELQEIIKGMPPVNPQEPKTGHCKDCKHFEYDEVAKVDGIPLIVAHEICNKWGDGCKTSEDGYCFLFEPQDTETWNGMHGQITVPRGTFERIFNDVDDNDI